MSTFNPDMALDSRDRAYLGQIMALPGYRVIHTLFRAELDKFFVKLLNAPAADDAEVLAAHKLCKAAAMFYEGVTSRINEEVMLYTAAPRTTDKPIDVTENVLDLGDNPRGEYDLYDI